MDIIIAVLNLLYVFSKRSNFLVRLSSDQRHSLQLRLNHLAESWGGKENGFGLAQCCMDRPITVSGYIVNAPTLCMYTIMHKVIDASVGYIKGA